MFRVISRLSTSLPLLAAVLLLLPAACNMPMRRFQENGPATPGSLSSGLTPPLQLTSAPFVAAKKLDNGQTANSSIVYHTVYHESGIPAMLPGAAVENVNFDGVLRRACQHNPEILVSRERVAESQIAFDAAMQSCMPEFLRKDTFKRSVAEAQLWRRRGELRKVQNDKLQDAAYTYIDLMAARRGEAISHDLMTYEEKLLDRAKKLASSEKPAKVIVEAVETAHNGRRQFLLRSHQRGDAAAIKLAYLLGVPNGAAVTAEQTLTPTDLVDATVALPALVKRAEEKGPGVVELYGLASAIEQGIDDAQCAQHICSRTGAALVCGRLQMAQSELQQAHLALHDLHGKLRSGVEEAVSAIQSGREQIAQAVAAIEHAAETYRLTDSRLREEGPENNRKNRTYNAVLVSIQQLAQAHGNYITAVRDYNKAQARLLLLIGSYNDCLGQSPCMTALPPQHH